MKLTVDSNVVVKWFVTELLSDAARVLLTPRIDLYAPDILLTDCANAIWKKFHTNEIPDPQPYFDELVEAYQIFAVAKQDVVDERSAAGGGATVGRAAGQGRSVDSPAYQRLLKLLDDLDDEERADVLALGWLEAGHLNGNWPGNLSQARAIAETVDAPFLARYGRHWRSGYERLQELPLA